jgi:YegS/Rv2252/BmrU family lipid kinase
MTSFSPPDSAARHPHKIAVIANPYSGNGRTARRLPELAEHIRAEVGDCILLRTESPGHATELVRDALRDGCDRIVSVGGDGTHHEVVNGFFDGMLPINPRAVMAIIPMGTGSDLARTLHMPRGHKAVSFLTSNRIIAADLGRMTFTTPQGGQEFLYFINTCHIGMGGAVVERVNRTSKKYGGFFTFLWGMLTTLFTYNCPMMNLEIDGKQLDQRCRDVIIANGQYDGGGMHVAPNARFDNGTFEVYVMRDITWWQALMNVPKIYRGRLMDRPEWIKYFVAKRITVRSPEKVPVNLDGEQPGTTPAAIEIVPAAINLVTCG